MKKYLLIGVLSIFLAVTYSSCSKSESPKMSINQSEVKLKFDGTFDFKVENASAAEWSSSDEFVGKVGSDGKFKAGHIGETTVTAKVGENRISAKVIVEPYITDIVEPYAEFGSSKASVKSFEKRSLLIDNGDGVIYNGQGNKEKQIFYLFENSFLKSSSLIFNVNFTDISSVLAKFYGERYNVVGTDSGVIFFQSKDKKKAVGISVNSSMGLNATYFTGTANLKAFVRANSPYSNNGIIDEVNIKLKK